MFEECLIDLGSKREEEQPIIYKHEAKEKKASSSPKVVAEKKEKVGSIKDMILGGGTV